ncbi:MAG: hypothetical protein DMG29_19130 [Acidobacteria bacterium]|nr:MAG: hypothetical protein DMG29_19130 [Acidobacteriota bacterium]HLB87564.1 hypothetical protein [Terriglobales bacterium]
MTREAKADEILKAAKRAAKVAKARKLSPAFDAECAAAEAEAERQQRANWTVRQHVMFGLGYIHGRLRAHNGYLGVFLLILFVVFIKYVFHVLVGIGVFLGLLLAICNPGRTPYQAYRYRQYRRRVYGEW